MTKCFYHGVDLDGKCSAAIWHRAYPGGELIPIDYGQPFPWDEIAEDDIVWMLDFSLQPYKEMERLAQRLREEGLYWIDHHASAIEEEQEVSTGYTLMGLRETGVGACELTWRFLHGDKPLPEAVRLLSQYDVWNLDDSRVEKFQYGMRCRGSTEPTAQLWSDLFSLPRVAALDVNSIIRDGAAVLTYRDQQNREYCHRYAFETRFMGYRVIAVNKGMAGSTLFNSVYDENRHDLMITFVWLPEGKWTISLYSTKPNVDVSVIAKGLGGGGHKGSAGFQASRLPPGLTTQLV